MVYSVYFVYYIYFVYFAPSIVQEMLNVIIEEMLAPLLRDGHERFQHSVADALVKLAVDTAYREVVLAAQTSF